MSLDLQHCPCYSSAWGFPHWWLEAESCPCQGSGREPAPPPLPYPRGKGEVTGAISPLRT